MLNLSHVIPIMATWHLAFMEISKHKSEAVSKNLNHLLHTLIYIAHYTCDYNVIYATQISIGFYLYDTLYLMRSAVQMFCVVSAEKIMHTKMPAPSIAPIAPYLLHHAIAICMLNMAINDPMHTEFILHAYYILATSNIMLYVSDHVHKECADRKLVMLSELVQFVWYTHYRIFKLSAFLYDSHAEAFQLGICACAMIATLYAMGVAWSHQLFVKNMRNCKTIAMAH
jgi:hypothetical protein